MPGIVVPDVCERTQNIAPHEDFIKSLKKCFGYNKAERLPHSAYYPLYSGSDLLDQMMPPEPQIIWGRRGTGKTHLLKAFTQKINTDTKENSLSFYISCEGIAYETPKHIVFTNDIERMKYCAREAFKNFLTFLIEEIINDYENIISEKAVFKNMKNTEKKEYKGNIDSKLVKMLEMCTVGIPKIIKKTGDRKIVNKTISETEIKRNISIGFSVKEKISGLLSFLNRKKKNDEKSTLEENTETIEYEFSFHEIQRAISSLVTALNINVLYICIDELWLIDEKNTISFQPVFLDYLRQVFFTDNRISVKIASIRETTNLYSKNNMKKAYGIQNGQDIVELANLDSMYLDESIMINKFIDILSIRIKYFSDNNIDYDNDYIINTMFKESRHFEYLVALSHGIPRNFLYILRTSLVNIDFDLRHQYLHFYLSAEVVIDLFLNEKRATVSLNKDNLYTSINYYAKNTNEAFFIISNEHTRRIDSDIKDLIFKEIIHRIPSSLTPNEIRDDYKAYYIDTGNFLNIVRNSGDLYYKDILNNFKLKIPSDIITNREHYVINIDKVNTDCEECPHCHTLVSKEHPVFKETGRCNVCAFKIK